MAITVRDKHGTFGRRRKSEGPPLDRASALYFAIVNKVWSSGYRTIGEAKDREAEMRVESRGARPQRALTIAEFGDTVWLPVKRNRLKPSSLANIEMVWSTHVRPALGDIKLRDLLLAINGLRVSEVVALDVEDLGEVRGHQVLRVAGKGGRIDQVPLRDVQDLARHADPRTTRRYDRGRHNLDRHACYTVATYLST
jgi:integrase